MKSKVLLLLGLIMTVAAFPQDNKSETLSKFLSDIMAIDASVLNSSEPIGEIARIAVEQSAKNMELTKENIEAVLDEAANFNHALIIVGSHTIVMITDLNDCRQSGTWAACMPMAKGYVQKSGSLHEKQDYTNNIIGIPDQQTRKIYFFKE